MMLTGNPVLKTETISPVNAIRLIVQTNMIPSHSEITGTDDAGLDACPFFSAP